MSRLSDLQIGVNLERIQKQYMENVKRDMPKVYFVHDGSTNTYRVGRTDWPGDAFNIVNGRDFQKFKEVYEGLSMPLIDLTDDDGSEWDKVRTA